MLSAGGKSNMQEQETLSESFHQTYMMSCVCSSAAVCHKHKDGLKSKYHTLRTTPSFQPSLKNSVTSPRLSLPLSPLVCG